MTPEKISELKAKLAGTRFEPHTDAIEQVLRGKEPLRAGLPVEVERANGRLAPNREPYHIKIKASTESVARDGGIIPVEAWLRGGLKNFDANPVILAFHNSRNFPVAKSVFTEIEGGALVQYWHFHEETPESRTAKVLYEKGYMRAASVGFLVLEARFVDELSDKEAEAFAAKFGVAALKDAYWIADRAELLETSAVPVPSDPNALNEVGRAFRSAGAVGIDLTSILALLPREFSTQCQVGKMAKDETKETPAVVTTPVENVSRADLQKLTDDMKSLTDSVTALKGLVDGLVKKETPAEKTETPEPAKPEEGERGFEVEVEVREGETNEQALDRTIDETVARMRGAPAKTK